MISLELLSLAPVVEEIHEKPSRARGAKCSLFPRFRAVIHNMLWIRAREWGISGICVTST
jgi:hypothetical protein